MGRVNDRVGMWVESIVKNVRLYNSMFMGHILKGQGCLCGQGLAGQDHWSGRYVAGVNDYIWGSKVRRIWCFYRSGSRIEIWTDIDIVCEMVQADSHLK